MGLGGGANRLVRDGPTVVRVARAEFVYTDARTCGNSEALELTFVRQPFGPHFITWAPLAGGHTPAASVNVLAVLLVGLLHGPVFRYPSLAGSARPPRVEARTGPHEVPEYALLVEFGDARELHAISLK
jgi:hypothetical protein